MRIGSLCTGYGGLDLAVEQAFGAETTWACDNDPGAAKIIDHRLKVPNLGDLTDTDWFAVAPVDILTAGWPCQPFSVAGKRKGIDDQRAIWPAVAAAVRDLRPCYVVLENVPTIAHVRTGPELARAAADLAALGYVGSWRCVRASDIGAPHRRERIFIVAEDADRAAGHQRRLAAPGQAPGGRPRADIGGPDRAPVAREVLLPTPKTTDAKITSAGDANRKQPGLRALPLLLADRFGQYGTAVARWAAIIGRDAPDPTILGRNKGRRLNPVFVEWMMGLPAGWVTAVPDLTVPEQIKALGNGVVPQQAYAAITEMKGS